MTDSVVEAEPAVADLYSLALNSSDVPGGLCAEPLPNDFTYLDFIWRPSDAGSSASPIGYELAKELSGLSVSDTPATDTPAMPATDTPATDTPAMPASE